MENVSNNEGGIIGKVYIEEGTDIMEMNKYIDDFVSDLIVIMVTRASLIK